MNADRRKLTEAIFQAAVDLPAAARGDYLREQCGHDVPLRDEVQRLLNTFDSDLGDFLHPASPPTQTADLASESPTTPPSHHPSSVIGHYQVEREIGRGGMGTVYLAVDSKLGRNVAIKMLPDEFFHDPQRLALFEREARTAANLNHPNIATIYELCELNGSFFIAMEYVKGQILSDLLRESEPLPLLKLLDIAVQIAQGLTAAHSSNIVHRDLKPGNIMITAEGRIKILDFGLAKVLQSEGAMDSESIASAGLLKASACFGTVGYSSPEQCSGEPVDYRSDLFSFGVVLYELATGRAPFQRSTFAETMTAVLNEEPQPPTGINADLPAELVALIDKLLAKNPEDRFQSSDDVLSHLRKLKRRTEAPRQPLHAQPRRQQSRQLKRRLRYTRIALGVAAVLVTIAMMRVWFDDSRAATDLQIVELFQLLANGDLQEATTLHETLKTDWGPDDIRLPDERLLELYFLIWGGEITRARSLQETLQSEWEHSDNLLRIPANILQVKVNEFLTRNRTSLVEFLTVGDFESARANGDQIQSLDEDGSATVEAEGLFRQAEQLMAHVRQLGETVEARLDADNPSEALEGIRELDRIEFEGQIFHPARQRSQEFLLDVRERLKSTAVSLLESPDEAKIADIDRMITLLREAHPQSQHLPPLLEARTRLEKRMNLQKLRDSVRAGMSSNEMNSVLWQMADIDDTREATAEVRQMRNQRREQERTFDDGIVEFEQQSLVGLAEIIEKYDATRDRLASPTADAELEQLRAAHAWLDRLERARNTLDVDLDEAHRIRDELDTETLSPNYRNPAHGHLDAFATEAAKAHRRWAGKNLCRRMADLCDRRLLGEAEATLIELESMHVEGINLETGAARSRVQTLKQEEADRVALEVEYTRFRQLLRSRKLVDARLSLEGLENHWRVEIERLDRALQFEERAPLRQRRALLNLRLGAFSEALSDAEHLPESMERALLAAQARFALRGENPSAIETALAEIELAMQLDPDDPSGLALYLRGVYTHALQDSDNVDATRLEQALSDLREASGKGFESADAYSHMAAIQLILHNSAPAIQSATRALQAPITEYGIIAEFGGNRRAVESDAIRRFQRDTYYARAQGNIIERNDEACISDCSSAIDLDPDFANGYFWRGFARDLKGLRVEAMQDLNRVIELIDPETADDNLKMLRDRALQIMNELKKGLNRH